MGTTWRLVKHPFGGLLLFTLVFATLAVTTEMGAEVKLSRVSRLTSQLLLPFSSVRVPRAEVFAITTPDVERIDAFVSQQMELHDLPGLALALVDGDQVIFMKGYGKADQTGRPVTPQTPFLLASVSKPLTAVAIM